LRLWNRAAELLTRLSPASSASDPLPEDDPFSPIKSLTASKSDGLTEAIGSKEPPLTRCPSLLFRHRAPGSAELRAISGTSAALNVVARTYVSRGGPHGAEYFYLQAEDLARAVRAPAALSRALIVRTEVLLLSGRMEEGAQALQDAAEVVEELGGVEGMEVNRQVGVWRTIRGDIEDVVEAFEQALKALEEAEKATVLVR
jgi:separase